MDLSSLRRSGLLRKAPRRRFILPEAFFVAVDKPLGMTSRDVVNRVRDRLEYFLFKNGKGAGGVGEG